MRVRTVLRRVLVVRIVRGRLCEVDYGRPTWCYGDDDELRDGGAALTSYARMQFEEMSDYEREEIRKALLKYCELDTMAMVMIYEGWKDLLQQEQQN